MILDKMTLFADSLSYNATPEVIDLESVKAGPGEPLVVFVQGSPDLAGATGVVVLHTDDAEADYDTFITHVATLPGETIKFELPSNVKRYVTISLTGTRSAGTWSAGIVLPAVQTNK